jgi:hypothetical protein
MNHDKPSWYERARKGPFVREKFDEGQGKKIERRITNQRDPRSRTNAAATLFAGAAVLLLAVFIVLRLQGTMPNGFAGNRTSVGTGSGGIAANGEHQTVIRAEGSTETGKLRVVPQSEEKSEALGAPSCMGNVTDMRFEGDYRVVYEQENGKQTVIASLPGMTFIQPSADTVQMTKLQFAEADVFLLVPQYADCHGITLYAYAIAKNSGAAFPLSFQMTDGTLSDTSYYPPGRLPAVHNGQLVLPTSIGPGGETANGPQDRIFTLDLAAKAFVQTPVV